ncbi:TetR/AcrR family transcriptional regulator [Gluconacetobacter tumulicola]|uniref:Helix-turn-helix transcriptional regulator n=1 Tax=Gluconacetobacter tumulicola TaxID=1017177 RepID=A0A7W4JCC6_9PROT|nr:helix-turn-helix domain-containing protein [Gluconacetobacter tumulicola]MBB2178643.1 helix-turn-helix transcriptional regulator [Gluconacetobacter tumulicola]
MRLFWDRGYEGARFDELTAVTGISSSNLYNAFGSKDQSYQKTTEFMRENLQAGCMISVSDTPCAPGQAQLRDLPADTDVEGLAVFLSSPARGMAAQVRNGASREKLQEIGRICMQTWPLARKSGQSTAPEA